MKRILSTIILAAISIAASAQSSIHTKAAGLQAAAEAVAADPALSEAVISFCARTGDGKTLVDIDADNTNTMMSATMTGIRSFSIVGTMLSNRTAPFSAM